MNHYKCIYVFFFVVTQIVVGSCALEAGPELEGFSAWDEQSERDEHGLIQDPACPIEMEHAPHTDACPPLSLLTAPPTEPSSLAHSSYTSASSFDVSWGSSIGHGLTVTYELQEQRNGGTWQQRYQGGNQSYSALGRSSGTYKYRVRGCSSAGCSTYRTGNTMIVNRPPALNLYTNYPFLYTHDVENAQYALSSPGFRSEFPVIAPGAMVGIPGVPSVPSLPRSPGVPGPMADVPGLSDVTDGMFSLGQGFDLLEDAYKSICIDTTHPDFHIVSSPLNTAEFDVSRSAGTLHLVDLLDISTGGNISFGGEGYEAGLSGSKRSLVENVEHADYELFVVKWARRADHWVIDAPADPLKPEFVSSMLSPNNENGRRDFRQRCGDKYVYAVNRGAKLYLVFKFDARSFSATERTQKAAAVEFAIESSLHAGGSTSLTEEHRQLLEQLQVQVKGYAVGGNTAIATSITRANLTDQFQAYVNSVGPSNYAAVDHFTSLYDHPTQFLGYSYFQIFADYRAPLEQLRRWNAIDIEREQRCDLLQSYGKSTANCLPARQELETAKSKCLETPSWSGCIHPLSYLTPGAAADDPGVMPANMLLYSWLGSNILAMESRSATNSFDHHIVDNGIFDKKCKDILDNTCLPTADCVVDNSEGRNYGLGQGFSITVHEFDSPGNGGYHNHGIWSASGSSSCVRTTAKICTSLVGSSVADFRYDQSIYGQCPIQLAFPVVN